MAQRTTVYVDGFNLYYALRQNPALKWLDPLSLAKAVLGPEFEIGCLKYFTARITNLSDPDAPRRQAIYRRALSTIPGFQPYDGNYIPKNMWRPLTCLPLAARRGEFVGGNVTLPAGDLIAAPLATDPRSQVESVPIGAYPLRGAGRSKIVVPQPDAIKAQVFAFEEKGSDVNLAVQLVNDAWLGSFEVAAIISNDSDLAEAVRIVVRDRGKSVILVNPRGGNPCDSLLKVASGVRRIRKKHFVDSQFPNPVIAPDGTAIEKPATWA